MGLGLGLEQANRADIPTLKRESALLPKADISGSHYSSSMRIFFTGVGCGMMGGMSPPILYAFFEL
jgi:hypothetical protein